MIIRRLVAATMALVLALAACGGTPIASEPVETDDTPVITPVATTPEPVSTDPAATFDIPPAADNGNGWPVTVTVTISGTNRSNGVYNATALARTCGNPFASIDPTGHTFAFEFPLDGRLNPRDIAFGAEDLVPGGTTTLFHLGADIVASDGSEPPGTVIDTSRPGSGDTGTASLTEADGKRTVVATATNDFGESITLTAVCGPAPG